MRKKKPRKEKKEGGNAKRRHRAHRQLQMALLLKGNKAKYSRILERLSSLANIAGQSISKNKNKDVIYPVNATCFK